MTRNIELIALAFLVVGCTKLFKREKQDESEKLPEKPVDAQPLEAQKSKLGILDIKAELRSDGLLVSVGGVPAGASVECDLDDKPLVPCHDGALFARPADGDHKISAVALKDGAPVAFGESAPFTVLPGTGGDFESDGDPRNSLLLVPADAAFVNGMAAPLTADFKASFKLAGAPECQVQLRCKYDSRTSQFWTECDEATPTSASFTVKKDLLALGLQYLSAQASCGDRLGPILTLFWYGVPDGYQPLMLKDVQDPHGRHVVELIRDEDCPEGKERKYECAAKGDAEFAQCAESNTFDKPAPGSRVRMSCAGTAGPELSF